MAEIQTQREAAGARPALTSFRGDFEQLARMMQASWAANREVSPRYTEPLLRSSLAYPGASFEVAPAIYAGDELIAFAAGLPRRATWKGHGIRLQLNTFLTVAVDVRKAGHGLVLWRHLMDRARASGVDGAVDYCVEGDDMNRMLLSASRLFGLNTQPIYRVSFLSRFVRPDGDHAPPAADAHLVDTFLELAASVQESTPLARAWTRVEAEWQCRDRHGAIAVLVDRQGERGLLTGYSADFGTDGARAAIVDDVLWGTLGPESRRELVQRFLRAAAAHGCQSAACPVLGYTSLEPFTAAGFRPGKRTLQAYLTLWNGLDPTPLPSMYLDVF